MNTETNTKLIALNPTQTAVLTHAIDHTLGKIEWFPENIKGGARQKVIEALFKRAMIIGSDGDWLVTAEGFDALGRERPGQRATTETATPTGEKTPKAARKTERNAAKPTPDAAASGDGETPAPRTRENSKQAQVIAMLCARSGTTIDAMARRPVTALGVARCVVVPSPRWPAPLVPHVHTTPSVERARLCRPPAAIALMAGSPGTCIGVLSLSA